MVPDLLDVQIKTTHINRDIYMLEATGDVAGNIGASVGPGGVLLVDAQFAPLPDQMWFTWGTCSIPEIGAFLTLIWIWAAALTD